MGKISIQDILDLAKAGYKPSDVKELFELAESAETKEDAKPAPKSEPKAEPAPGDAEDAFEKLAKS